MTTMEMRDQAEKFDQNSKNMSLDESCFSLGAALPSSGSANARKRPYNAPTDKTFNSNKDRMRSESQEKRSNDIYLPKKPGSFT